MVLTLDRTFYIRKGALKIADRKSDAVAYVYEGNNVLFAQMFFGKQAKPVWHYRFKNGAAREKQIAESFASRQASLTFRLEQKAKRIAQTHNLTVGHILSASWGYDQTNVNFYQVTKIISPKMVELRAIGSMSASVDRSASQTSMSGHVLPVLDRFTGEPIRKRANRHGVKIDSSRYASIWNGKPVFESSWH